MPDDQPIRQVVAVPAPLSVEPGPAISLGHARVDRLERALALHRDLLEQVARAAPLPEVLDGLVRLIEEQSVGGLVASVLVADEDGRRLRHGAAPSLPEDYNAAIDGIEIGPRVGSCGTAAFLREPVVVTDIESDPLWSDFRELARAAGLRACWSTPLISGDRLLGTFAMYYPTPRAPVAEDLDVAALFARTAALAIERHRAAAARERALAAEAEYARRLSSLAGVSLDLAAAETLEDLLEVVLVNGLSVLGADGGAVAVVDRERGCLRVVISESFEPRTRVTFGELPLDGPLPSSRVARTGVPALLPTQAAGLAYAPEMAEVYAVTGRHAWAVVPLSVAGQVIGSLAVSWAGEREFGSDDLELIDAFAGQCAVSVSRILTRLSQRDAALAAQRMSEALQRSLLSRPPHTPHLAVGVRYLPAVEQAQIGGDWYDAFHTASGHTMLVVGDVNGHDRDAAAAMGQLRNMLRGLAFDSEGTPAALLRRLDRALRGLEVETLATAVLAQLDQPGPDGTVQVRWSTAGHLPPLLRSTDGSVQALDGSSDLLLGFDPQGERRDHTVTLAPGDTLLLYTDGLVERRGESIDDGVRRLLRAFGEHGSLPLEDLCDALLAAQLPDGGEDDVALLAVRPQAADAGHAPPPATPVSRSLEVGLESSAVHQARELVSAVACEVGLPGDVRDDAVLLASEVVTNALVHAGASATVRVSATPVSIRVEVDDCSERRPRLTPADLDATGGRGLNLLELLAARWGVQPAAGGKTVWFEAEAAPV